MKNQEKLIGGLLVALFFGFSVLANANDTLSYKKKFPANAINDNSKYIVLSLYVTKDDNVPVATQTYYPGDWELTKSENSNVLQVEMSDVSYLQDYPDLWAETEVDGVVVGSREIVTLVSPGMSVWGLIESRSEGFKFPDATVQTTAGSTPADLASHLSNASAHHSPVVTTAEILDGTIVGTDVNPATALTVGSLTVDGNAYVQNRLGIGTFSPSFPLDVSTSTELRSGYFYNTANSTSTSYGIWGGAYGVGSGDKRGGGFEAVGGSGTNIGMKALAINGSTNVAVFGSASGGSPNWAGYFENGNVYVENKIGIGTLNPTKSLHISGGDIEINGSSPWIYLDNTSTGNSGIYFQNSDTTNSQIFYNGTQDYLYIGPQSGNYIVVKTAGVGINTTTPGYALHVVGNSSSDIAEFYNSSTNSGADVIRAKINQATPATLQYFVRCVDGTGGTDGGVRADGSGGVQFYTTSDRRLKMNIRDFSGALALLEKIQPRQYEMKQAPDITNIGFIAQELNRIYPTAVAGDEDSDVNVEPMMVDYSKLTPLLAGATKELHQKVKEQQSEIDHLHNELAAIKKLLEVN